MNNHTTKRRKPTRWNTKTFKERVYELVGDEYTFHDEYETGRTPIKITHNECGYEYRVSPTNFLGGTRCRECMYTKKSKDYVKTHKQFLKDLHKVHGNDYVPTQEYTGVHNKIDFKHTVCGKTWNATPSMLLNGSTCVHCHGKVHDEESFIDKVYERVGLEFTPLEVYKDSQTKMKFVHNHCGNEFESTSSNMLAFKSCPYCDQKRPRYTEERYRKELEESYGDEFGIVGTYRVMTDYNIYRHKRCGREFEVTGSDLLYGYSGCPHCSMSLGEADIARYLEFNNIDYINEHVILECRNILPLPFDFATFKDGKLTSLIEFEGGQHYRSIEMFGGDEGFAKRQRNDQIKRDYCKDNNIKLIEIPHWKQDNIPKILNEALI